ncbi:MAG: hypothetical protein QG671_620 [Actinomycetota bacterium]|nr:hypothetical protein [Actinomycetota bacterium]
MDPVTVAALTAVLTAAAGGAGGEAGKSAWTTLTSATRRILGRAAPASTALDVVEDATDDPVTLSSAAAEAAGYLLAGARDNPDLATLLHAWYAEHTPPGQATVAQGSSSTTNVVSGTAHVTNLIQARDVSGDITFRR